MPTKQVATRYHDFSCGHRVVGHEGKCALLHGHNYRVHFHCVAELDAVGRVIDFSVMKERLCQWLEEMWDHKFLAWDRDRAMDWVVSSLKNQSTVAFSPAGLHEKVTASEMLTKSIVWVPFNPTAENMATYLLETIAPRQLAGTGVICTRVVIEETRKCSAEAQLYVDTEKLQ